MVGWGVPKLLQNGSIELADGLIKDVMSGKVDVLISAATIVYGRYLVIDYLQPIMTRGGGIYVKKDALHEGRHVQILWLSMKLFS